MQYHRALFALLASHDIHFHEDLTVLTKEETNRTKAKKNYATKSTNTALFSIRSFICSFVPFGVCSFREHIEFNFLAFTSATMCICQNLISFKNELLLATAEYQIVVGWPKTHDENEIKFIFMQTFRNDKTAPKMKTLCFSRTQNQIIGYLTSAQYGSG